MTAIFPDIFQDWLGRSRITSTMPLVPLLLRFAACLARASRIFAAMKSLLALHHGQCHQKNRLTT